MNPFFFFEENKINMKNFKIVLAAVSFLFVLHACKEKTTTEPTPAKTLNKALLYNKVWYAQSGHKHEFKDNGVYKGPGGTWQWMNNSDSMLIKPSEFETEKIWYFKYCTATEMACALGSSAAKRDNYTLYKDTPW
jgi:hypothetical protein